MTDERDLRNFEPAAPLPEGARGRSRVEAGLPPAPPARPADDRMAVLPQWAIAEFERLRKERDEARSECDRARDSAGLYMQMVETMQGGAFTADEIDVCNPIRLGGYVVEGPR